MEYKNNCYFHPDSELEFICIYCNIPICEYCLINHEGHRVKIINLLEKINMLEDIKKNPLINKKVEENKNIKNKCNTSLKQLENESIKNLQLLRDHFKHIHLLIHTAEKDLEKQILLNHERNIKIQSSLMSIIENENKVLELNNIDNSTMENVLPTIAKDFQHLTIILNKSIEIDKIDLLNQLSNQNIIFKKDEKYFSKNIKDMYIIENKEIEFLPSEAALSNKIEYQGFPFYKYKKGMNIKKEVDSLVFGIDEEKPSDLQLTIGDKIEKITFVDSNHDKPLDKIKKIMLADGFKLELDPGVLPNGITGLYLGYLKCPLKPGSIPSTVKSLHFLDGFSQELGHGIIPSSVTALHIGDVKYPFKKEIIPKTVRKIIINTISKKPI